MDEESKQPQLETSTFNDLERFKKSPLWPWISKGILLVFFLLLIQMPLKMISDEISSRQSRENHVADELEKKWGGSQVIAAPLLVAPERKLLRPEVLNVKAEAKPEVRSRGIYSTVLYTAEIHFSAEFPDSANASSLLVKCRNWECVTNVKATVNGKALTLKESAVSGALEFPLPSEIKGPLKCEVSLGLHGSRTLAIHPVARRNTMEIAGAWGTPSFNGKTLPAKREVKANHFAASWGCDHFSPTFSMTTSANNFPDDQASGVDFLMPVSSYAQTARLINYATLFVCVFFFALLLSEIITKTPMLGLQYLVATGAPVLFYLMVLSFSEHLGFAVGYWSAAGMVTLLIAFYSALVFAR